jgi:hypothetical protein
MKTRDVDKYLEQLYSRGFEKGRCEGFANGVLDAYQIRFGEPPDDFVAVIGQARDCADLERWLVLVVTHSAEEVMAALRRPQTTKPAKRAGSRRSVSSRRTSAPK